MTDTLFLSSHKYSATDCYKFGVFRICTDHLDSMINDEILLIYPVSYDMCVTSYIS